ncbi:hypothetical protein EFR84_27730 [Rhizobium chutanense]|uniref:Uncharacterized protein n=1 Tax=Rhizobium chutanense TaxID=2035448 RepID=A0A3S0Q6P2_9HYPH|nr:hypothetical protein EFR84_27730 [Rhizobium chutanense]
MLGNSTDAPGSLIPVLVTGIQPRRVRAVNDSSSDEESLAPRDLGALDSYDEHRNEGGEDGRSYEHRGGENLDILTLQNRK